MFKSAFQTTDLYKEVHIDTGVRGASPHRLIELLFEKALEQLTSAERAIESRNTALKGELITHVIRVIDEGLRASLNYDAGEVAHNLGQLYDYMLRRLLYANQHDSIEAIAEVKALMSSIYSAWTEIDPDAPEALNIKARG